MYSELAIASRLSTVSILDVRNKYTQYLKAPGDKKNK